MLSSTTTLLRRISTPLSKRVLRSSCMTNTFTRSICTMKSASSARCTASTFAVGAAVAASAAYAFSTVSTADNSAAPTAAVLTPKEFRPFTLRRVEKYNHNTSVFIFEIDPNSFTEYPVSSFVMTRYSDAEGKEIARPYTPINADTFKNGELHLLVKDYPKGNMSSHFHQLKVGDSLDIKGPIPKLKYTANHRKEVGMVAGGTGITPMLQVIEKSLNDPTDQTKFSLVFANQTPSDILLKKEIDELVSKHSSRFQVTYTVDSTSQSVTNGKWEGEIGHVSKEMLSKYLPSPSSDNFVYVCGPPGFMVAVSGPKAKDYTQGEVSGILKELGWNEQTVFKF